MGGGKVVREMYPQKTFPLFRDQALLPPVPPAAEVLTWAFRDLASFPPSQILPKLQGSAGDPSPRGPATQPPEGFWTRRHNPVRVSRGFLASHFEQ